MKAKDFDSGQQRLDRAFAVRLCPKTYMLEDPTEGIDPGVYVME